MHVVILGNGISGITTARYLRKLGDYKITVISKETDFFFSRTALMYLYMGHMRFKDIKPYEEHFWSKNRIDLIRGRVDTIDFESQIVHLDQNFKPKDSSLKQAPQSIGYDRLVLALGSASNKFGWPGQDLKRVQGLYSFQDVENMERLTPNIQHAVVVGGGLIGIEMAEMFHSRHIPVTMLVREDSYWNMVLPGDESRMVGRQIVKHGIDLRLSTELKEIRGNQENEAIAVVTNEEEVISCEIVGLTAGVHPNVRWLKETPLEVEKGILVNEYLQTNLNGVYAIGDCAQLRNPNTGRRAIEAVWYTGRMMGEVAAHNIHGNKVAYDPGIWFNSAKFFDIEYQVYGQVPARPDEMLPSIYWEAEDGEKSIRIVYHREDKHVVGFNLMGIRFRHEVCEKWIANRASLESVIKDLALASFDPEFFPAYHREILDRYNKVFGVSLKSRSARSYNSVFGFLK
ncbi:MAG: NAD(P)/FAD-dependent oxidoreductase [Saprospiraceae bacterium]|nr:NAD(P)/FAD-dependent oxidoreductase [Saprospiraceae bacterium]